MRDCTCQWAVRPKKVEVTIMKIAVGCDEAALVFKNEIMVYLQSTGHTVTDVGVYDKAPVLYADTAKKLCDILENGTCERGLLFCGTGIGMAITANKIPGIRAAVGHDIFSVERSVRSNNCQVLCMGSRVIAPQLAVLLLERWLECTFDGGPSAAKVNRIMEIEREGRGIEQCKE